jgi:hypothetical protein
VLPEFKPILSIFYYSVNISVIEGLFSFVTVNEAGQFHIPAKIALLTAISLATTGERRLLRLTEISLAMTGEGGCFGALIHRDSSSRPRGFIEET